MTEAIGVLVERRVLQRALKGRSTLERVAFYRHIALCELRIDIILFCIEGVQIGRGRVQGYVPSARGWRRVLAPIPKVVHKRVLYRERGPIRKLERLRRRGIIFVNPHLMQNKEKMNDLLSRDDVLRGHLPATQVYRWRNLKQELDAERAVILKPRVGSVGRGILRVEPLPGRRFRIIGDSTSIVTRSGLYNRLKKKVRAGKYLLQEYIRLAQWDDKPFDLRVPVQRDGSGAWQVPGMVAKVARKHPFLTNLAQGGRAVPGESVIHKVFAPEMAGSVVHEIRQLAIRVAEAVSKRYPHAADLGLDIGVGVDGKPWLIEVITRDQRITFYEAGMHDAFRTLYRNPLAYCFQLAQQGAATHSG